MQVLTGKLNTYSCIRLTDSRLCLILFFRKLEGFFFFVRSPAFLIVSIHFWDTSRRFEDGFRLDFNGLIKHFIPEVELLVPIIYLGLNRQPQIFSKIWISTSLLRAATGSNSLNTACRCFRWAAQSKTSSCYYCISCLI